MPINFPDQTIAAQVPEAPNAMTQISQLLDLQTKRNQITSGNIRNTSDQANLDEEQGVRSLMQNFDSYKGQDGNVDMNKFVPDVLKAAPTKGAAIISGVVNAQKDGTMAKQALGQLNQQQRGQIAQFVGSMAGNGKTPQENEQAFNDFGQNMPDAKPIVDFFHKHVMPGANASPEQANAAYLRAATSVMSPTEQISAATPDGVAVNNGQQSHVVNLKPTAPGGIGAPIAGTGTQQQLPPSTPVLGPNNTPGYLGPTGTVPTTGMSATPGGMQITPSQQQGMNAESLRLLQDERAKETDPANQAALDRSIMGVKMSLGPNQQGGTPPKSNFVASGMPVGAAAAITGTQDVVNKHFSDINSSASNASQDVGILQNIISHAHGAATGVGAERQALAQAIAGKLGISVDKAATTDTNLLLKNSAMLQLAGGDTNLAKTLAGAANPNNHMDEDAIKQAAYQVIGQKQMALAGQKLFTPLKELADHGSPEAYNQVRQKFDAAADPRIMQLPYMTPAEVQKMRASMTPQEQKEFRDKITTLHSLGIKP